MLLVQASYRRELSLLGGWIDRGEAPEQTARRELFEELGGGAALGAVCAAVAPSASKVEPREAPSLRKQSWPVAADG